MNAKEEFLKHTFGKQVLCAIITTDELFCEVKNGEFLLPRYFTEEQLTHFLNELDFNYDSGYGSQELSGTIWYTDGTWSSRGEYDGSEWWEYNVVPEIPKELTAG